MKSTAIHQHDDWFLVELPGYGDIPGEKLEVDIHLAKEEINELDYKELRGMAIMERYFEKRNRTLFFEPEKELVTAFDKKFGTADIRSMDDILERL